MRLDLALVEKKLIETRTKAKAAIESGIIFYMGKLVTKPSQDIQDLDQLEIRGALCPYVSRGGLKLEKALHSFQIDLTDKDVLDIGSSTGGFTDCALQHGAKTVVAVDVGTDQLVPVLRTNPAVTAYEKTDFRQIDTPKIAHCTIAVSDVSFISITKMIPKLKEMPHLTDLICLIKPQFECGKEMADKYHGVITNKQVHQQVLENVISKFHQHELFIQNLTFSPIQGGSGNIEYLVHFSHKKSAKVIDIQQTITSAVQSFK